MGNQENLKVNQANLKANQENLRVAITAITTWMNIIRFLNNMHRLHTELWLMVFVIVHKTVFLESQVNQRESLVKNPDQRESQEQKAPKVLKVLKVLVPRKVKVQKVPRRVANALILSLHLLHFLQLHPLLQRLLPPAHQHLLPLVPSPAA